MMYFLRLDLVADPNACEGDSLPSLFAGGGISSTRSNPKFKKCTHAKVKEKSRLFNQVKAAYKFVPL